MKNKVVDNKEKNVVIVINYIRYYRTLRNMTQKEVAEKIGITPQRFASLETNKHIASITKILAIAETLSVKLDDLYKIEYISTEEYYKIRHVNLEFTECDTLKSAYQKLDTYKQREELNNNEKYEFEEMSNLIKKNSIFRYGNVLESLVWERIMVKD